MYVSVSAVQVCKQCRPQRQYIRLCDVTERTAVRKHKTGRRCRRCRAALYDTIVHFGEKGGHQAPYNWQRAASSANSADVVLCLGSSLKACTATCCYFHFLDQELKSCHYSCCCCSSGCCWDDRLQKRLRLVCLWLWHIVTLLLGAMFQFTYYYWKQ